MDVVYCPSDTAVKDEIGKCIECECYGLLIEFIEEKFCSLNCRERSFTRKALITKRTFAITKETSKKRKLFEIALKKSRPSDENDGIKLRPILPKVEKAVKNSDLKSPSKDKTECRNDKKTIQSVEKSDTVVADSKINLETQTPIEPSENKSESSSNVSKVKSENSNTLKSIKSVDVLKTIPKLVHLPEPLNIDPTPVVSLSEEKKTARERRLSVEQGTKSSSTNTPETVSLIYCSLNVYIILFV